MDSGPWQGTDLKSLLAFGRPIDCGEKALECLIANGAVLMACRGHAPPDWTASLEDTLRPLCTRIPVFAGIPGWRIVGVDPSKEHDRSEGVGASPLHIDFVNAEWPPEYIALVCVRADPLGGGQSTLSPLDEALACLAAGDLALLSERLFVDGRVENLLNIGGDMNPFSIVDSSGGLQRRYTAQLLKRAYASPTEEALQRLQVELEAREVAFLIPRGAALVIDQRRFVHGKRPLGPAQHSISPGVRRCLLHGFFRSLV